MNTIDTAVFSWFSKANGPPGDAVIATLARYTWVWLWQWTDEQPQADGSYDMTRIDAIIARVKAVNPQVKFGWYGGVVGYHRNVEPAWAWLSDAELFHDPQGAPLIHNESQLGLSCKFPNLLSTPVRQKMVQKWLTFLTEHHFDGMLWDSYSPDSFATLVKQAPPAGYFGLPDGIEQGWRFDHPVWWANVMDAYTIELERALRWHDKILYVNGVHPTLVSAEPFIAAWQGPLLSDVPKHATGTMSEGFLWTLHDTTPPVTPIHDYLKMANLITSKGKWFYPFAGPGVWHQDDPATPWLDSLEMQRYFLAFYLLIQERPYTQFGYAGPWIPYYGWSGWGMTGEPYAFWSPDWDRDYGDPVQTDSNREASYVITPPGITPAGAARQYTNGIVTLNWTDQVQLYYAPGTWRVWDKQNGQLVTMTADPSTWLRVPPKTGYFLWTQS